MAKSSSPLGGMFSGFLQQVAVFKELTSYVEIDDEAIREFTQFLHTSKGGSNLFAQLAILNKTMGGMINCLGQGFLSFDSSGTVSKITSKACLELLEINPSQKKIWEVLKATGPDEETIKGWVQMIFENKVDFETLASLGTKRFPHSQGKTILLEYYPMRASDGKVTDVVMVATDHTERELASRQAELERKNVKMVIQVVKQKRSFHTFVTHFRKEIVRFRDLALQGAPTSEDVQEFVRFLHTMKGGSSIFSIDSLVRYLHSLEDEWTFLKSTQVSPDTKTSLCRELITKQTSGLTEALESFLVKHRDILGNSILQSERVVEIPVSRIEKMKVAFESSGAAENLLNQVAELAKEPIASYLQPYTELVNQIAEAQHKLLEPMIIENGELSIFPEPYEDLISSFVHIFRNAIDHGIETQSEREKLKKPPGGKLSIRIKTRDDNGKHWLDFIFEDDGRGIDPKKIRSHIESSKFPRNWINLNDTEIIQKIFEPGFSTKGAITSISGRGIGLDAVQFEAHRMGGSAHVSSKVGLGCQITVSVPDVTRFLQKTILQK